MMGSINIVYVIESAAHGVICTSCLCQKPERARYKALSMTLAVYYNVTREFSLE